MIFIEQRMLESIFKSAMSSNSVGRVQALSLGRECVPIVAGGVKFLVEFVAPPYLQGESFFQEMLYIDQDGDFFIPKFDHRRISIWTGPKENGEMQAACFVDVEFKTVEFSKLLQRAVFNYSCSYPNIDQYFFEANEQFGNFVQQDVLFADKNLIKGATVKILKEIAAPFYGFTITHNVY